MRTVANLLAAAGMLAFSYCGFELVTSRTYQAREMSRFPSPSRAESQPPTAVRPYPAAGSTMAKLAIPRLELSAIVLEGAEERQLKLGPGHIRGTSLPGEGGNVGLAAHRDSFFRPLRFIQKSDTIKLTTYAQEFQYRVVSTEIVQPEDVRVLYPAGYETLTLVTCYPFDFVGPAPKRFIVHADCMDCGRR